MTVHEPVLLKEVIEYLRPCPGKNMIDCTLGGGGHSFAILDKTRPNGKVLAIDEDSDAIERVKKHVRDNHLAVSGRFVLVNDNFRNIKKIYESRFPFSVSGIICDLGLSSDQLEISGRGFSFQKSEPLEMTFSNNGEGDRLTAMEVISKYSVDELERIFRTLANEPYAGEIANAIVEERKRNPIKSTDKLVDIIVSVKGHSGDNPRIHPATKVFQAIRMTVNDELGSLKRLLLDSMDILESGGRLAIISFHELEDRMVKRFFKEHEYSGEISIITKKPVVASAEEIKNNPRSRSAKLRVAEKT